jgi:murein DD-endopeptidase MepM/ murein hydrolase activator NlpD
MQDNDCLRFAGTETQLSDNLTFGKPVFASAGGTVAAILEGIPDNPIGQINTRENWGNYVCINHGYGLYSFYAHLKKGSINVKPGDYLKQGDRLGQVGNSGRSPLPHCISS